MRTSQRRAGGDATANVDAAIFLEEEEKQMYPFLFLLSVGT